MTDQLIKVETNSNGQQVVSARDLHKFLEASERFINWMQRNLQYGFEENVDYLGCKQFNTLANQELIDYALTLDCAKEISMLQRSDKGKQARLYFIECERRLLHQVPTPREIAYLILRLEDEKEQLQNELAIAAPKVEYTDKVLTSVSGIRTTQIAKELGMSAQKLNLSLKTQGVQYKLNNQWVLTAKYQNLNFTESITVPVVNKTGQIITTHLTVWTEQGRRFIHSLFNGNLQTQDRLLADKHAVFVN
jgi:anti-repressor protein